MDVVSLTENDMATIWVVLDDGQQLDGRPDSFLLPLDTGKVLDCLATMSGSGHLFHGDKKIERSDELVPGVYHYNLTSVASAQHRKRVERDYRRLARLNTMAARLEEQKAARMAST